MLTAQDTHEVQHDHIIKLVEELAPGMDVHFKPSTMINFVVSHPTLKINLTEGSGDWIPSELANKSDDWLKAFIKQLSNGKIR